MGRIVRLIVGALLVVLAFGVVGCDSGRGEVAQPVPPSNSLSTLDDVPQDIQDAVEDLAPIVMLHKDEIHLPSSIDWYLSKSDFQVSSDKTIASPTTTTIATGAKDSYLKADDTDELKAGKKDANGTWPTYVAIARVRIDDRSNEYLVIKYNTFYPYNRLSKFDFLDDHFGDWERVTILAKRAKDTTETWSFMAVNTRAHTYSIMTATKPHMTNKRARVYAAKRSHGTWPTTDSEKPTDFGLLDDGPQDALNSRLADECSSGGTAWDLSTKPTTIRYVEYKAASATAFASPASFKTAGVVKDRVTPAPWVNFDGKWGQSSASPETNVGITETGSPGDLWQLGKLLKAHSDW